jgi:hypothetical protein
MIHRANLVLVASLLTGVTSATLPLINQGLPTCYKLQASRDRVLTSDVCFFNDHHDKGQISVEYQLHGEMEGWQLDAAYFWVGSNVTDIPIESGDKHESNRNQFPFYKEGIDAMTVRFALSLSRDLGFVCPDEGKQFLTSLHARAKNRKTEETIHLHTIHENENIIGSLWERVTHLVLSCPADASHLKPDEHMSFNNPTLYSVPSSQRQRRTQLNCPALYPAKEDIVLELDKAFITRMKTTIDLAGLVYRSDSGPIEDIIEEQRKNFEFFDGWSDFNDQALVAKPFNTSACWAVFQSTEGINPLGT